MTGKTRAPGKGADRRRQSGQPARTQTAESPGSIEALSPEEVRRTLYELRKRQVELEMENEQLRRAHAELDADRKRAEVAPQPAHDALEQHARTMQLLAEIAERRRAEHELKRSNERLQAVQRIGRMGYLDWDLTTNKIVLSREASEIYHLDRAPTPEEVMGFVHPDDMERVERGMTAALSGLAKFDLEHRAICPDGTEIHVHATAELFRNDEGAPVRLLGTVRDIADRKRAEAQLQWSLREKEALLKEVHHRVKNNLQVVTSLLRLEAGRSPHPATKAVLLEMQGRIRAMALLHESLYRSETFAAVDLGAYLRKLTAQLVRAQAAHPGAINLDMDIASVEVMMDQAIPCGLLVNELVTNSLKHAFPDGRKGEVRVELQPLHGGSEVRLRVSDTGVGLPGDFEARRRESLGLQLVSDLARQLRGTLEIGPGSAAAFAVTFTAATPKPAAN